MSAPGQPPRPIVLRLDGESWIQLPLDIEGILTDMRIDGRGRLWIAGGVRTGDASGSGFIARLEQDHLTTVEKGFDSMVFRIAFPPEGSSAGEDEMIVAGAFTQIGSGSFARIARWQSGAWQPLGAGFNTGVSALAWAQDAIYVSNEYVNTPGTQRFILARWDGGQWIEVARPENGMPPPAGRSVHQVRDLLALGTNVIAVGSLIPEGGGGRHVYVYDGTRLAPLDGGVGAISVDSVTLAADGLWFAGMIAEAGLADARTPSIGIAHFRY
jgi:trimeric autotransporter adhesin